jgi:hypothetical protein
MPKQGRTNVRYFDVARIAAVLPGYASVARASEVLHLAPRSVRDLIYSGRLPSLRVGRLHYVRTADLELERRRRLGLPVLKRQSRPRVAAQHRAEPRLIRPHVDPIMRKQRADERASLVRQWARRHHADTASPSVPFSQTSVASQTVCAACARQLRTGARAVCVDEALLCTACARRALLQWADQRRLEAAAARDMAHDLGTSPAPRTKNAA